MPSRTARANLSSADPNDARSRCASSVAQGPLQQYNKSCTSVVVRVLGAIMHWLSQKQSGTALAVDESELDSEVTRGEPLGIVTFHGIKEPS